MTTELPSCTLQPAALNDRIEEIRAIGTDSLIAAVSETEFHFKADAKTRKRLQTLVEGERACCESIRMELREHEGHLALTISGPGSQVFHRAFTSA